jgi:hypothetical protein
VRGIVLNQRYVLRHNIFLSITIERAITARGGSVLYRTERVNTYVGEILYRTGVGA